MHLMREKDVVNKKRIKQSSFKKDHINIRHDFKTDFRLSLKLVYTRFGSYSRLYKTVREAVLVFGLYAGGHSSYQA